MHSSFPALQLPFSLSQCLTGQRWCCFWIFIKTSCFTSDFCYQWHIDNRTIIQHCTIMQVQESYHEYLWEQMLRKKKINLCCVPHKTAAALWNKKHLKYKKTWACCWNVWGFSCISIRIQFFACSCIWAVCGITTLRYQIPQPLSHLKQHELLQASCGVFLMFSHRDSLSQIKVFDTPCGLGLS